MGVQRCTAAGLHEPWKTGARPGRLRIDDDEVSDDQFSLFLCVNTEYMGRDKVVFPEARIDDGYWDLIICRALSRGRRAIR